jgi:hypothetical protein
MSAGQPPRFGERIKITDAGLVEIRASLGLRDEAHARELAARIEAAVRIMMRIENSRTRIPDVQRAKRHLESVAAASRKLASLLKKEPFANLLFSGGLYPGSFDEENGIILPSEQERNAFEQAPGLFTERLEDLARVARLFAGDDERFRLAQTLPNPDQGSQSIATMVLWPVLFYIWTQCGRQLAYTDGGPLHRFIEVVHRNLSLPRPTASSLRDAIRRYMADRQQK